MAATPPPSSTAFLRIPGVELACASFTTRALTLTAQPDGHATLAAAAIVMQAVRATTAGARIDIERVALEDVLAEVAPIAGVPAITSFVARHVVVEHLRAALARGAVAAGDAPQPLQLDALRRLDGLVHAIVEAHVLGLAFLVTTRSRGAWIGAAGGGLVAAALYGWALRRQNTRPWGAWARPAAVTLAIGAVAALVPVRTGETVPSIPERLATLARPVEATAAVRLALWRNTADLVADQPWLGVGRGRYPVVYPLYQKSATDTPWFGFSFQPLHPHNELLEHAAEIGVPAAAALAALVLSGLLRSARDARIGRDLDARAAARAGAITAMCLAGLVSFPLHGAAGAFLVWLLVGRGWAAPSSSPEPSVRRKAAWVAGALVVAGAWLAASELRGQSALARSVEVRGRRLRGGPRTGPRGRAPHAVGPRRNRIGRDGGVPLRPRSAGLARNARARARAPAASPEPAPRLAAGPRRLKDGRIDEAEELFRRALDVEPTLARAWLGVAMTREAAGDPAGSREACANAVRYGASFEPARTYCMRYGL